ncbi:MAG: hypothetical protein CMK32_12685 [Porticoccaceae bacterium]|nr:hypothetical protein [Porticoccaceae bacterium]
MSHALKKRARIIAYAMMAFFSLATVQMPAHAALLSTDALVSKAELQDQRDALTQQLLRDDVKKELLSLGVDPADVETRINSMTASEISQVQGHLANLPAGGSALGTVALVLVILILLEIAGVIDIFPKL